MTGAAYLVQELKRYRSICYYPSAGTDLSDLDFFGSGRRPWGERIAGQPPVGENPDPVVASTSASAPDPASDPDLFLHSDINFYQEFAAGKDLSPVECGLHGACEVVGFRELPALEATNRIYETFPFSGRCFEYRLRVWGSDRIRTLIHCLCENEFLVSQILLAHGIEVPVVWSRNWAGSKTCGTWLANVLDRLHTGKVYTDWLCLPGQRGEPPNPLVAGKYPELMVPATVKLVRNEDLHWIVEGAHGWVDAFDVVKTR
ncbi:MAG: hypothetical protein GX442_20065 [Candidatus Riflebacteria bacterium]|nr:hypothetical protein [Candidatus Riflebacteria bacterium]